MQRPSRIGPGRPRIARRFVARAVAPQEARKALPWEAITVLRQGDSRLGRRLFPAARRLADEEFGPDSGRRHNLDGCRRRLVERIARPARRLFIGSSAWEAAGANHACQAAAVGRPRDPPLGRRPFQVARRLAGPAFGHDSRDAGHLVCRRTWPCGRDYAACPAVLRSLDCWKRSGGDSIVRIGPHCPWNRFFAGPTATSKCMANGRRRLRVRSQGWRKHGALSKSPCATDCEACPAVLLSPNC